MRNPVRKLVGVAIVGVVAGLFALPVLGAGAQTVPGEGAPTSPGACSVSANAAAFPTVAVTWTAPSDITLKVYFTPDGGSKSVIQTISTPSSPKTTTGTFNFTASGPGDVTANYVYGNKSAYTTECTAVAGVVVQRVQPTVAGALAFTGSSHTGTFVLAGLAAVALGSVLLVAARRRSQVTGA